MIVSLGGLKLTLDWAGEDMYLDISPFHSRAALKAAYATIDALGLEPLSEEECPAEELPDGGFRVYLAETADLALASVFNDMMPEITY